MAYVTTEEGGFEVSISSASANMKVKVGNYTGDGQNDRPVTGVGFTPCYVLVYDPTNTGWGSYFKPGIASPYSFNATDASLVYSDKIKAFNTDGFTVGNSYANQDQQPYHYLALGIGSSTGQIYSFSHEGDGNDDHSVTDGSMGFTPDFVIVRGDAAVSVAFSCSELNLGTGSFLPFTNSGIAVVGVKSFISNGFTLGTSPLWNNNGTMMYYTALKTTAGMFKFDSYVGTGETNPISGLGFQPCAVIVKRDGASTAMIKTSEHLTTHSTTIGGSGDTTTGITVLGANGFTVESDASVNTLDDTYYWYAFKAN